MKPSEWVEERALARAVLFAEKAGIRHVPGDVLQALKIEAILEVLDAFEGVELKLPHPKELPP